MALYEKPEEVVRWMERGSADRRGVTCLDNFIYLAFNEKLSNHVHVMVLVGDDAWLDRFTAAATDFECVQTSTKEDFAEALLAFWPNDESARSFAELVGVSLPRLQ